MIPRRISGPKGSRKLPNEVFQSLYCSPNIAMVIKYRTGHIAIMEGDGRAFKILTAKPTGNNL